MCRKSQLHGQLFLQPFSLTGKRRLPGGAVEVGFLCNVRRFELIFGGGFEISKSVGLHEFKRFLR